jgi:integrase
VPKLTKTIVEAAELRVKQYTLWCSDLKGFGAYIHPTGKRTYFVDYRTGDGRRRRMTIGVHGVLTTEQARKLAISTLGGIVLAKEDPLQERQTRRRSLTVAQLCDQYMAAAKRGLILGRTSRPKKASTIEIDRGRIARHIKPLLGSKLVIELERADVARFVRDVTAGKTAVKDRSGRNNARVEVRGGPGTAARTTGLLGGILTYAVDEGIIATNPARGVKLPADQVRNRRLTAEEYRQLGEALLQSDYETPQAKTGAWLLALTGCRLGEVSMLKWPEVDEAGGCFRLQDSKSGPSVRPVGRRAFDVLAGASRVAGSTFVLPGLRGDGTAYYRGLAGAWDRLMTRAGLEGVTPHTMRHSFASVAGDLGFADSTIGALLGHAGGTITSRYVHRLDSVLVAAANKVCSEIYRQMTGAAGNVVDLPRRA